MLLLLLCAYITARIITISGACYLIQQTPYAFIFMFVYASEELHMLLQLDVRLFLVVYSFLNGNKEVWNFQNFTERALVILSFKQTYNISKS